MRIKDVDLKRLLDVLLVLDELRAVYGCRDIEALLIMARETLQLHPHRRRVLIVTGRCPSSSD